MAVNAIVRVDGDNVDQALKLLKKKIEREGLIREIKKHAYYEKPTEVRRKKLLKARRKQQKLQRKLQKSTEKAWPTVQLLMGVGICHISCDVFINSSGFITDE